LCRQVFLSINFNNNSVFRDLLLDQHDLFRAFNYKVPTRIIWALSDLCKLLMALSSEPTIAASQHDWHIANYNLLSFEDTIAFGVFDIHVYWCRICEVSDSAFVRREIMLSKIFLNHWLANINIRELEIVLLEVGIVRRQKVVCSHHLFHVYVDKVIERVDVLFNKSSQP